MQLNPNMQYRRGAGEDWISVLGYGCMRFTKENGQVDLEKAGRELMAAIDGGVNYLDTAYIYAGSEAAVGKILARHQARDRVYIATKLPQYLIKSRSAMEKIFREELSRLQTDHIDYYLMHMITDVASWRKLEKLGVREWIAEKKAAGEIRHIGFSFHGNTDMFLQVLNAYDWDFCQIQYNYMDEFAQAGRKGLESAAEKGIPVMIMEPLRGGRLVSLLPESARRLLAEHPRNWNAAQWAFNWLWDQAGVSCVLSGMNSMDMVAENLNFARQAQVGMLDTADFALINRLKDEINRNIRVACTGCGYCMPCPRGVDIPGSFRCLNALSVDGRKKAEKEYWQVTAIRQTPGSASRCIGCGKCEAHCPQGIPIRKMLKEAARNLETPFYRIAALAMKIWKPW